MGQVRYLSDTQIETCAFQLLQRYGRLREAIARPPVPIEKIIEHILDLQILWESVADHGGQPVLAKLVAGYEQRLIVVNEDLQAFFEEHEGVQEYSLAHEAGHYVLHVDQASLHTMELAESDRQETVLCRAVPDVRLDSCEWQAERFASYLLMPRDLVLRACADTDLLRWDNVYQLRKQFSVSITALMRRLKELHLVAVTADRKLVPYKAAQAPQGSTLWG